MAGRFGQWGGGGMALTDTPQPVTGTVTTPPTTPSQPAADGSPSSGGLLSYAGYGGGDGGGGDPTGGVIGPNPEWGMPKGSYGVGGGGIQTSAQPSGPPPTGSYGGPAGLSWSGPMGASSPYGEAFEDGGEADDTGMAPTGDTNGAAAPTGDTNSSWGIGDLISRALSWGRAQFQLPKSFYGGGSSGDDNGGTTHNLLPMGAGFPDSQGNDYGNVQAAFDGGVIQDAGSRMPVPDDNDQDQNGGTGAAVNPQSTIHYLAGAGGVSPDVANALEQRVDPQGHMDQASRVLAAIQAAGQQGPQAAFGVMQHYRTRYNAHAGAAAAAFDQGNTAEAAKQATQAMAHVPTGHNIQFAPMSGGMAVITRKAGAQPQQQAPQQQQQGGFDDGGAVDVDNPSRNRGYADGGEVDDEDDDQAVIPTGPTEGAPTDAEETSDLPPSPTGGEPPDVGQGDVQTDVLNGDKFKQLIKAGYDKPIEKGWLDFLSDLLVSPAEAQPAPVPGANGPQSGSTVPGGNGSTTPGKKFNVRPGGAITAMGYNINGDLQDMFGGQGQPVAAAVQANQPQGQGPGQQPPPGSNASPDDWNRFLRKPGVANDIVSDQQRVKAGTPPPPPDNNGFPSLAERQQMQFGPPKPQQQQPQQQPRETYDQAWKKYQNEASQLYPWASQTAQRTKYITDAMTAWRLGSRNIEQAQAMWGNRSNLQGQRDAATMQREQFKQGEMTNRQGNALQERLTAAQIQTMGRNLSSTQTNMLRGAISRINAGQDPAKARQEVETLAQQWGMQPQSMADLMRWVSQGQGQQPPGQQQGGQQQGQGQGNPQMIGLPNGKVYVLQPNGKYREATSPGQ